MSELTSSPVPPTPSDAGAGVPRPAAAPAASHAAARAAQALPPIFDEAGVTVTAARIVAYGQAAPLKGATSVRLFVDQRHLRFAMPILIAGLLLGAYGVAIGSSPAIALAVMLIVVSYLTWRFQTLRHKLFLVRSAGETEVLASSNIPFTERVKAGLELALASQAAETASAASSTPSQSPASVPPA